MIRPKIFIGPMSENIVAAIIEYVNENDVPIGIIPSRRQVEHDGGYVNNWETKEFAGYIKSQTDKVLLCRDHAGPSQGTFEDDGIESFMVDATVLDLVHVDVWKKCQDYEEGLRKTVSFIKLGYSLNANLFYEVGTEEAIRPTTPEELDRLLGDLRKLLKRDTFDKIKYCVIQSGTALEANNNIGTYSKDRLVNMVKSVKKYGIMPKEHNGDYLAKGQIREKFKAGLECINIAPEFGAIETALILDALAGNKDLIEEFYQLCLESKRWVKWVPENYNPEENKSEIIRIAGHYVFSDSRFVELRNKLFITNRHIRSKIKDRIEELVAETRCENNSI
tara:strand:+ start:11775 stop:12779 length:1005 start_codon:yes stop_codon:yes gene_type:complete